MEGKITKGGTLEILRGSRYEVQQCPNKDDIGDCGGWCPLFGEPETAYLKGRITICQGRVLEFDNFTDERE